MPMSAKVSSCRAVLVFVETDEKTPNALNVSALLKDRITTTLGRRFPNLHVIEWADQADLSIRARVHMQGDGKLNVEVLFDDRNKEAVGHVVFTHDSSPGSRPSGVDATEFALETTAHEIGEYLYEKR
jgi:hypothetical protein